MAGLRTRPRRDRDRGLTLMELVISIAIMGLISTVIAAVITSAFKNNPMVELRTDTAHTLQGVVTWLPQDVDSTPPDGFDTGATTASGCSSSPGVNLLRMEWKELVGGVTTRYVANYRWIAAANSTIVRVTCYGTGASPLGNSRVLNTSGPLMPMTASWAPGQLPARVTIQRDATGDVTLVSFDVQTTAGDIMHVDSAPKNPAHTLPPTTLDAGYVSATTVLATTTTSGSTTTVSGATTTSSTTTTTLPPCTLVSSTMSATSMKNTTPDGNGNAATNVGVLQDALTINVTTSGYCTGLDARATTGAPNSELFHNFTKLSDSTFTVTFPGWPQGSSELWADGTRPISFSTPTGTVIGSVNLVVK